MAQLGHEQQRDEEHRADDPARMARHESGDPVQSEAMNTALPRSLPSD
jgi:hypothetical protein